MDLRPGHKKEEGININITPLIDVIFLLLIFFMVSSTFREHFGMEITLPEARTATEREAETQEITVSAEGDYFFGEQRVDEAGLRKAVAELLQAD